MAIDLARCRVLDLSQDWDIHTPGFALYEGPTVKWIKRVAFERAGGQWISLHAPRGDALGCAVTFHHGWPGYRSDPVEQAGRLGLHRRSHPLRDWRLRYLRTRALRAVERDTGIRIQPGDILVIHTGYHHYYPSDWATDPALRQPDETRYFIKHPGPTRAFAEWVLRRQISWLAVDCASADHPFNTVIRKIRADLVPEFEAKHGKSISELLPDSDYQVMHFALFPHGVIHIENAGGEIDKVLNRRIMVGCFPWRFKGGEAAFCRFVAFVPEDEL
jgi:arylformamidase